MKVAHIADLQVKDRDKKLIQCYQKNLSEITNILYTRQDIECLFVSGDLFEYPSPKDSERTIIYNFLAELTRIKHLQKIYIIAGNHDLEKIKKAKHSKTSLIDIEESKSLFNNDNQSYEYYNPIKTIIDALDNAIPNNNIVYIRDTTFVQDFFQKGINLCFYSLEDTESPIIDDNFDFEHSTTIGLYHGMLREYVDDVKLPIRDADKDKLLSIKSFPKNTVVLAGDIHQQLEYKNDNTLFVYSGSTQQHTHNEGQFFSINSKPSYTGDKNIIVYDINNNGTYELIEKIKLTNYVTYITIDLTSFENYDELIQFVTDCSQQILIGSIKTYLKIKSSNKFLTKELQIKTIFSTYKNIIFDFVYDKLVRSEIITDNVVNQILVENVKNCEEDNEIREESDIEIINKVDLSDINIDKLRLNNEQIVKMFGSVVDKYFKKYFDEITENEFKPSELKKNLLVLFTNELNNLNDSTKSYNIELQTIKCNQFMTLGETILPLALDNTKHSITRILGSNGVGKTTLYRMIRWVLTGEVFEGMKTNQTTKNNMIIFNKDDKDNNIVKVVLQITVNGKLCTISRICKRIWKLNIANEDKISINWKDNISTITKSLEMTFIGNDGTQKCYKDNDVQKLLNIWFDENTLNTMFLNQLKIESILKSSPDYLNNLILNNIGLSYLDKLENNLDSVKDLLELQYKPKKTKFDIEYSLSNNNNETNEVVKKSNECQTKIIDTTTEKNKYELITNDLANKLMTIGDVKYQITSINDKIFANQNKLLLIKHHNEEEFRIEKSLKDIVKPVSPDKELNENTLLMEQISENSLKIYNEIIRFREKVAKRSDSALSEIQKDIDNLSLKLNESTNTINNKKDLLLKSLNDSMMLYSHQNNTFFYEKITPLKDNISVETRKVDEIQKIIDSGICPTCKRPFENFLEKVNEYNEQIKIHNDNIINYNSLLKGLYDEFNKTETVINRIRKTISSLNSYTPLTTSDILNDTSFYGIVKKSDVDTDNSFSNDYYICQEVKTYVEDYYTYLIEKSEINDNIIKYNKQLDIVKNTKLAITNISITQLNQDTLNYLKNCDKIFTFIDERATILIHKHLVDNNIVDMFIKMQGYESKINDIKTIMENYRTNYRIALEQYAKTCEDITLHNQSVKAFNQVLIDENAIYDKLSENIESLTKALNDKKLELDEYNTLSTTYQENKAKFDELSKQEIELIKEKSNIDYQIKILENQKNELNETYEAIIKYEVNKFAYKIYSKIVKDDLKVIIFEYYRRYLNVVLDNLLDGLNFKLFWNTDSNLYMMTITNGQLTYVPVSQCSGMETIFNGLSLIYTLNLINIRNRVSHIFIDELSGQLSKGIGLTQDMYDTLPKNYQELFVEILKRFKEKHIFVIDHNIEDMKEDIMYEVVKNNQYSKFCHIN